MNGQGLILDLEKIARRVRLSTVEMSQRGGSAHLASALSVIDILTVLYWGGCAKSTPGSRIVPSGIGSS